MHTKKNTITSIAPGRICLFGDHQDYLELPIIACAINRFVTIEGTANKTQIFNIELPDLRSSLKIDLKKPIRLFDKANHFHTALHVLKRYGCLPNHGFNIKISGDIPINAGLSSSSAVMVAWINFLIAAFGFEGVPSPEQIAKIAYEAEVIETGSSGGKMDQFSIALGDIIYLETDKKSYFERLSVDNLSLIIGESGVPKATLKVLKEMKDSAFKAIEIIKESVNEFDLKTAKASAVPNLIKYLPDHLKPYLSAAIKNHDITIKARLELQQSKTSLEKLGELMNAHHMILKDDLILTVPKIDSMIKAANLAGALGSKIVGSGKGGSIVSICSPGFEEPIIKAMLNAGAKDAYQVNISKGVQIKHNL